jgi:carboxymethylenebutenolidase
MKRIVTRILIGSVIVIAVIIALVGGSVVYEGTQGASRLDAIINTRIKNPNGPEVRAYIARPKQAGQYPAVIMIHEFWGLNQDIIGKAEALAQEGYVVVAPDVFRGGTSAQVPRAIYQVVSNPPTQVNADLDSVFAWLISQPDVKANKIAIMGFCFGGGTSLNYSLSNNKLAGTVILYGSPIADVNKLKSLSGPVLGIFGGADASIPVANVRAFESALKEAGVKNQISIYENQPHAFVKSVEEIKKDAVQTKAWNEALTFLKATLQSNSSLREVTPAQAIHATDWRYLLMLGYEHALGTAAHH